VESSRFSPLRLGGLAAWRLGVRINRTVSLVKEEVRALPAIRRRQPPDLANSLARFNISGGKLCEPGNHTARIGSCFSLLTTMRSPGKGGRAVLRCRV
jgi:hypothetical protein